ncbi:inositol monophosphatase [Candidatus Falkowbacteria bacterium]|nr:MAG: inositol monophosphatase [Candidatus Falkowbacteria bacterium]
MINQIKKVATKAIKNAGKIALGEYKNFDRATIKLKAHQEILTKVDLMSEKVIIDEVKKNFPEHSILSEEAGDDNIKSEYLWIIDPIDGTTNFSMHNPLWCVSVGIAYRGEIVLGFIYAPCQNELYTAQKGQGAYLNGKKIKVSNIFEGKILNAFCSAREIKHTKKAVRYFSYQKLRGGSCYMLGSAALELGYVAAGRLESMVIPGAHPWDVAAGVLLVREAGGIVSDFKGGEWTLRSENMLASNGKVHREVLKVINK